MTIEGIKSFAPDLTIGVSLSERYVADKHPRTRDGYFYLLDDDSVFLLEVYTIFKEQSEAKFEGMIVGNQKYGNNSKLFLRLRANSLVSMEQNTDFPVYIIGPEMVIPYHKVLRHIRWTSEKYYHNDCYFWSACYYYFGKEKVILIDKFVSYYNFFVPKFKFKLRIGFIKIKIDAKKPISEFLLENIYNLIMRIRNNSKKQPTVFINHFPFDRKWFFIVFTQK